jgi:hypothetical protein
VRRPLLWAGGIAAYLAVLLWIDRFVTLPGQLLLGALTAAALFVALRPLSPRLRAQTLLVVAVATVGEVMGSIVWGLYTYRLENLPAFVPPAHGLVFVGGVALGAAAARRPRLLVGVALAGVVGWGAAGVTVLPRADVSGALGAAALALFLLRGRAPAVYAGVFLVVAALELYGTALGTWAWAERAPGTPLTQGNPPSGIAAGYVLFDIVALALAPRLLRLASKLQEKTASRPAAAAAELT